LDPDDEFGGAVAYLGDLDGSGGSAATLAVAAAFDDDGGSNRGAAWVLFLNPSGTVSSHQKISHSSGGLGSGLDNDDQFGSSLAVLGDIDGSGEGAQALVVGAVQDDDGGSNRGAAYVLFLDGAPAATDASIFSADAKIAALGEATPNPSRPITTIPYSLGRPARVRIDVCDLSGRVVRTLVDESLAGGEHHVIWNGMDDRGGFVQAGTFFVRMMVEGQLTGSGKVQLLR
jgi:hypothetical protein